MQTLLVGLDAACLPVLEPLFEAGDLPHLEAVFEQGVHDSLQSQVPPWTASAWPSLYTGMNPGKHGVFDFLRFDGYEWDIVNTTDIRQRTLWEYADEAGLTSVVVNAPVTSPPAEVDGAIIPGYLAAEDPPCHPAGILEDVREEIGEYRVYARRETDERGGEQRFADYLELARMRGEAFRYLADRFDPEFGFIQFQKTDAVFHDYPGDHEKVRQIYRAVDKQLGQIREQCDPATVIVASDHGMGEYDGYQFRANQFLHDNDFVETTTDGQGVPSWFQIKDEQLTETDEAAAERGLLQQLAGYAANVGLTYQRGKAILERLGLAAVVGRYVPVSAVFAASDAVDFTASRAYLRSPSELGIRLNVEGRDPDGTIPESEYEDVRAEIIELLSNVTTPDGEPLFEEVVPRETHIYGPYADEAVDILTVPTDFQHELSALIGPQFDDDPEPWNHKPEAVIALAGQHVKTNDELTGSHLFDVAPTVLSTLGIDPESRMDGTTLSVVESLAATEYSEYDPQTQQATEDSAVAERLSDLGYLE